jgi:hypothetical protein
MRNLTKAIAVVALLELPVPLARAQSTPAFDGTYEGVSRTVEATGMMNYKRTGCTPDGKPAPLMIAGGAARAGAGDNPMEGSVNARARSSCIFETALSLRGGSTAQAGPQDGLPAAAAISSSDRRGVADQAAGCGARAGVVRRARTLSDLSWPQAAEMSRPRGVRTGAE